MNLSELYYYDELTQSAQAEARRNVAASVETYHGRSIGKAFFKFQRDPHKAINDPLHIKRIINGGESWRKIRREGDSYLTRFIRSNRVIFTECGAYVAYVSSFTMFIDGLEYIPTATQQKALRGPYIDVNGRGPDYHDWLYKMHHKIKHFMIR